MDCGTLRYVHLRSLLLPVRYVALRYYDCSLLRCYVGLMVFCTLRVRCSLFYILLLLLPPAVRLPHVARWLPLPHIRGCLCVLRSWIVRRRFACVHLLDFVPAAYLPDRCLPLRFGLPLVTRVCRYLLRYRIPAVAGFCPSRFCYHCRAPCLPHVTGCHTVAVRLRVYVYLPATRLPTCLCILDQFGCMLRCCRCVRCCVTLPVALDCLRIFALRCVAVWSLRIDSLPFAVWRYTFYR